MATFKRNKLKFTAHSDAGKVDALLLKPASPTAVLVLGHGAGAGMEHATMEGIAEAMAREAIATMRYQFPFMQRGGGRDRADVSYSTIREAVELAAKKCPGLPIFAGGHSFGGRMTTLAEADSRLGVNGLVCCSFPLHMPGKVSDKRIQHFGEIKIPVLFLSGDRDKMMTFDLFEPAIKTIRAARKSLATLHKIFTADHGYKTLKRTRTSAEPVFDEMARITRAWIEKVR